MNGKDKCKILKEIRRQIAEQNDIEWIVSECKHQGECKGTCPRCESEVRQLERELERRRSLGRKVALVGISAACLMAMTGCTDRNQLEGDVPDIEYTETEDTQEHLIMGEVGLPDDTEWSELLDDTECSQLPEETDCLLDPEPILLEGDVPYELPETESGGLKRK